MYFAFIKLRNVFLYLREPPSQLFFLGCGGLGGCVEVSWGCSLFVLLTIVFQIISETQLKSLQFAVLIYHPCLQVVGRCVCLPATGGVTVRVARVLVSNTRTRRMFAPFFLSFFFFPPKWSSLHKGLVNPFKYAQQTQKCVMLTASLVTYNIFSPNRCLQKLLRQVTSAPVLRGVCVQKIWFQTLTETISDTQLKASTLPY